MRKYEKNLKKMIELSNGGCDPVEQELCGLTEAELRFLAAKNFLLLKQAGNNEYYAILTSTGLSYFSDKRERFADALKDRLIGFIFGVLVTVAATWIIQTVL